jgi:CheY-like chemotaxis protein/HPt (histidine-containing phosphotransfer) domain-containing protein
LFLNDIIFDRYLSTVQASRHRNNPGGMIRFTIMNTDLPMAQQPLHRGGSGSEPADATAAGRAFPFTHPVQPVLDGAHVLLVDDSDIVRDVTRAVLEDAGLVVDEAQDGAAAVRLVQAHPKRYVLILMDVQMPVMDGLAATRLIRVDLGERMPPIVALTAHASEQDKANCLAAGMLDHVSKPVDPDQLMAVLNRWLAPAAAGPHVAHGVHAVHAAAPQLPPEVPGFDRQAGLQCVGGNEQRLRAMLARFGANYAAVVAELRQLAATENYREARRLAHTLKGAAATLGGMRIAEAAERVEHAMLQRCESTGGAALDRDPNLSDLDTAMQHALPVLRALALDAQPAAVSSAGAVSSTAIPQTEVAEFEALRQLLAGNRYAARKAFGVLHAKLGVGDAAWQAAATAVDALDFQQALARLDVRYSQHNGNAG